MAVRYLFNTPGEYVAFVENGYIFNPNGEWLGVVTNGNEVYNTNGLYIGLLLDDDRIVADRTWSIPKSIPRLSHPLRPTIPIRPLRRLSMVRVPYPYQDVFEHTKSVVKQLVPTYEFQKFDNLIGSSISAGDGTFLGEISKNRHDQNSISNVYGPFGSPYSDTSIFNDYCPYGGKYGIMSPFNPYNVNPPKVLRKENLIGHLTVNEYILDKIDANHFLAWLNTN
jgi:hypothetical protein